MSADVHAGADAHPDAESSADASADASGADPSSADPSGADPSGADASSADASGAAAAGDLEDAALAEGLRLFDAGLYWECHEALEPLWLDASGDDEAFFQGIIQAAAALDHVVRSGRLRGARHLVGEALAKLAPLPARARGVDLAGLAARLVRLDGALAGRPDGADPALAREVLEGLALSARAPHAGRPPV